MCKKIGKFLKFAIIGIFWTVFWLILSRFLVLLVWNFDFLSKTQWGLIAEFWKNNGTIRSFSDYMLFLTLFLIVLLWYRGYKKLYRTDYGKMVLKPFEYFSNRQIEKYKKEDKHVVIKNLVVGQKMTLDDLIAEKIKQESSQEKTKEAETLRQTLSQKIIERKGK